MSQVARNLTDAEGGFPPRTRFLIHDRDPLFTEQFGRILEGSGVRLVKLPARSPNLNAYAERFVRSIKSECLAQVIPLGERHLRRCVSEYVEHYHHERNHQGLGNDLSKHRRRTASATARSSAGSGSAACFATTGGRPNGRLSFGTLRGPRSLEGPLRPGW